MNEQERHRLFSELVTRHRSALYGYIFAVVRSWEDADDLFQSVCLVLWNKFESFQPGTNFFAWARQTAKNKMSKFLRHKQQPHFVNEELLETLAEVAIGTKEDWAEAHQTTLQHCRERLVAADEELLALHYGEGLGTAPDCRPTPPIPAEYLSIAQSYSRLVVRVHSAGDCSGGALQDRAFMSNSAANTDRLLDLAGEVCNGTVSRCDLAELDSILLADQKSCRRYLFYCDLHVALRLEARADIAAQNVCQQTGVKSAVQVASESDVPAIDTSVNQPLPFFSTALYGTVGWFSSGWPVAYLIATAIFGVGLVVGALVHVSDPVRVARQSAPISSHLSPSPHNRWPNHGHGSVPVGAGFRVQGSGFRARKSPISNP